MRSISQLSETVVKLETEANEAARKMEEAYTKAQISRQKMIQVIILPNIFILTNRQVIKPNLLQVLQ